MTDRMFKAFLRPLSMWPLEPEDDLPINVPHDPGSVALAFLRQCVGAIEGEDPLDIMRGRYADCSLQCAEPVVVPEHPFIRRHVVQPLLDAKRCYVMGMPIACIAQAGFVGEMLALWRYQMLAFRIGDEPVDEKRQALLYGREFLRLGQHRRVEVLDALGDLDAETRAAFGTLRRVRNRYLHYMVDPTEWDMDADAREALRCACDLLNRTLRTEIREGAVVFAAKVMRFIQDIIRPVEQAQAEADPE